MSTQTEVEASYDVGNDFFRLWLDNEMNYTCAVWDGAASLEDAQEQKLDVLSDFGGVTPGSRVLDVGCGWGAALRFLVTKRYVRAAHGITLSRAQYDEVMCRQMPGVTAEVCDYRDYVPAEPFDAVLCLCMMEHIATPADARRGDHIGLYREFFRGLHQWTRPGARVGLQTILRDRVPRRRADLHELGWITDTIFPGGISLRLEDVARSVGPWWEIMEVRTRRADYERTTAEWLARLNANERAIRARWGDTVFDRYRRYLGGCVHAFRMRYQSLAQYSLLRVDNTG